MGIAKVGKKSCVLLICLLFGAILGVFALFNTGYYWGYFDAFEERDNHVNTYFSLVTAGYVNMLCNTLLRDLPEDRRIVESDFGATSGVERINERDYLIRQSWHFRVEPIESDGRAKEFADQVLQLLTLACGEPPLSDIALRIVEVSVNKDGVVTVDYEWGFQTADFARFSPRSGIFRDLAIWCRLVPPPKPKWL